MTAEEINGKHVSFITVDEEDGETEIKMIGIAKADAAGNIYFYPDDDPVNMYSVELDELTFIGEIDTTDIPDEVFEEIDGIDTDEKEGKAIDEERIETENEEELENFEGEEIEIEEHYPDEELVKIEENCDIEIGNLEEVLDKVGDIKVTEEKIIIEKEEIWSAAGHIQERTITITIPNEVNIKYTHAEFIAKMILEGGGSLIELFECMKKQFPTAGDNNIKSAIKNYGKFCIALGIVYDEYIEIEGAHKAIKGFYLKEK